MARIDVKPDKLDRIAAQITAIGSELNSSAGKLNGVHQTIESAWKSQYTPAYVQEIDVVKNNIRKIAQKSDELAQLMKKTASEIRRVEEENRRSFMQ